MQSSDVPTRFQIPWGNGAGGGFIRPIPVNSQIGIVDGAASLTDGFPPLTFDPVAAGGVPPFGADMNGILRQVTQWSRWAGAGGPIQWNSAFSAAVGGYPKGAVVAATPLDGTFWISTAENNTTDPDAAGVGWETLRPGGLAGGDLTGSYPDPDIAGHAVTNDKLDQMPAGTVKANPSGVTADADDVALADFMAATTYTSGAITLTPGAHGQLAHGFGVNPKDVKAFLVCTSPINGYAVGDVISMPYNHGASTDFGIATWIVNDDSSVKYQVAWNSDGHCALLPNAAGVGFFATSANFSFIVRAWL